MTTKIIPPIFITQTEEALDKGYDPKVARGLLQFVKPYTWQMLIALVFMIIGYDCFGYGSLFCGIGH